MNRFRILHLIRPAAGGMKNHLLSLLRHCDREMFDPILACPGYMARDLASSDFRVIELPIRGELSPLSDLRVVRQLISILKDERITILHAHSSKAGLVGRVAAKLAGTPLVLLTAHNSIFYEEWPFWKKSLFAFAERLLNGYTDRLITVSEALRNELIKRERLDQDKVVTIQNGIETEVFETQVRRCFTLRNLDLPLSEQVVGMVARLASQKGVTYFLKAAAMLAMDYKVNFVIIGDGPLHRQLEEEALSLGIKDRVVFAGERHDIPYLLPAFDVFVLSSLTEGLPLTILEALAAGCPVVATRVGGIPEIIRDNVNGLLVEPADPAGLAIAVASLLSDPKKAADMGQAGKALVKEKFTAVVMVRKVEDEYRNLLSNRGFI
ncbi:MAG: Glycosyl transferase group 1 [Desulfotomaculum sp. 46_296]|nr:MAG: Glycosyl transferase group 1 [Desulfotomaculum sp. 46_296]HAU32610.1 glycosyltransferase family 1 protein [Desulfotomaculum sp.]